MAETFTRADIHEIASLLRKEQQLKDDIKRLQNARSLMRIGWKEGEIGMAYEVGIPIDSEIKDGIIKVMQSILNETIECLREMGLKD